MHSLLPIPDIAELNGLFEDIGTTLKVRRTGYIPIKPDPKYLRVGIKGKKYLVHRILYKMRNGIEPPMIDHIDGNALNNSASNLRVVTRSENQYNRGKYKRNTSGYKNVFAWRDKWMVMLTVQKKQIFGGYFKDLSAAVAKAKAMQELYHGPYAYTGEINGN